MWAEKQGWESRCSQDAYFCEGLNPELVNRPVISDHSLEGNKDHEEVSRMANKILKIQDTAFGGGR